MEAWQLVVVLVAFAVGVGCGVVTGWREHERWERGTEWLKEPLETLNDYARLCHESSRRGGWWTNLETGAPLERNRGEMLMLMVTELAEAMEGERKGAMDDKLPHRKMTEVELADTLIRIFDYAGGFGYDLEGAFREKLVYNQRRADHQPEARRLAGGKKF